MKKTLEFLSALRRNNNREWFEANRSAYSEALAEFNAFAEKLIAALPSIDPGVAGLALKDCTYRIYRDTRFSHNKDPYKTHMGVYICPKGKKSGYAGYYFHVEPSGGDFIGNSLLAVGLYCPEPAVLKSVRDEILDNGAKMEAAIKQAKGFVVDTSNSLKRVPTGYPSDSPYAGYLKLKDVSLFKPVTDEFLMEPDLLERTVEAFKPTVKLNNLLNRAVAYAHENM